jgi:phosphohistidine phosphatase
VTITVAPGEYGWIATAQRMQNVTADFHVTLGNQTYDVPNVTARAPMTSDSSNVYVTKTEKIDDKAGVCSGKDGASFLQPSPVAPVAGGLYNIAVSGSNQRVLSAPNRSRDAVQLELGQSSDGRNQPWRFIESPANADYFEVQSDNNPKLCLDLSGTDGKSILQWPSATPTTSCGRSRTTPPTRASGSRIRPSRTRRWTPREGRSSRAPRSSPPTLPPLAGGCSSGSVSDADASRPRWDGRRWPGCAQAAHASYSSSMLWLLRHAEAADGFPDDERPLTERGMKQAEAAGLALARLGTHLELCLCSPKLRAVQTAELACAALGVQIAIEPALSGEPFDVRALTAGYDDVLLVGHDPSFTLTVHDLTGAQARMRKGGLAAVSKGELVALLRPAELSAIAYATEDVVA